MRPTLLLCFKSPQASHTAKVDSDTRCFRSAWLCSEVLTNKVRPVMDRMVNIEARDNHNRTTSFLPHVTLFSGNDLSIDDCEQIMGLFCKHCPQGISLRVVDYREAPLENPPVQLIFSPENQTDTELFNTFKKEVAKETGQEINVNNQWLHSTLLYKNVQQPMSNLALKEAKNIATKLIGSNIFFDQYALVTGQAWIPADIAKWAKVDANKFNSIR